MRDYDNVTEGLSAAADEDEISVNPIFISHLKIPNVVMVPIADTVRSKRLRLTGFCKRFSSLLAAYHVVNVGCDLSQSGGVAFDRDGFAPMLCPSTTMCLVAASRSLFSIGSGLSRKSFVGCGFALAHVEMTQVNSARHGQQQAERKIRHRFI
jgi:hypothetical protein